MLMKMGEIVGDLLADQVIHGGADGVQLFDTWAGLSPEIYRKFVMPATARRLKCFEKKSAEILP